VRDVKSPATHADGSLRQAEAGLRLADRYELQRPIASGGMAQVWAGHDHVLGRRVAIKVLHPHLASDQSLVRRFRGEAVAAARLRHACIVDIYDTVADHGLEAIVMELCEGTTLRQLFDQRGQLPVLDVIDLAGQVADALDVAHRGGVVHRDIKPSNILLTPGGRVLVTDFGIAKAGAGADLTVTGTLLGTAKYLAPEQVEGVDVDPRADLYALGVVMFEALCGRPPFLADTEAATALARLHQDPPPPRSIRPEIPPSLESIVLRSLARRPAQRWGRATDLRAALSQVRFDEPDDAESPTVIAAPPRTPPPRHEADEPGFIRSERSWLLPAILVILTAAALGVSGTLFTQTSVGRDLVDRGLGRQPTTSPTFTTPTVPASDTPPTPIDHGLIGEVRTFDPFGDDQERDELRSRVIDDDLESYWPTETYNDPDIAGSGLKPGVGLLLEVTDRRPLDVLEVRTLTEGWRAEVYVADEFGRDRQAWGPAVAVGQGLGVNEVFDLDEREGSWVLLWITHTGRSVDEAGRSVNRTQITDVRIT
jgi:eukaryotic-like serine/threonine-protein kinase